MLLVVVHCGVHCCREVVGFFGRTGCGREVAADDVEVAAGGGFQVALDGTLLDKQVGLAAEAELLGADLQAAHAAGGGVKVDLGRHDHGAA
eukprot:7764076-Pyramimonas_sp.AAC.1